MKVLQVDYNALMEVPFREIIRVNLFFDNILDLDNMVKVVDLSLYRNRGA